MLRKHLEKQRSRGWQEHDRPRGRKHWKAEVSLALLSTSVLQPQVLAIMLSLSWREEGQEAKEGACYCYQVYRKAASKCLQPSCSEELPGSRDSHPNQLPPAPFSTHGSSQMIFSPAGQRSNFHVHSPKKALRRSMQHNVK